MNYELVKKKIRTKINSFDLSDNLFELADASILINKIFQEEKFNIIEYTKTK